MYFVASDEKVSLIESMDGTTGIFGTTTVVVVALLLFVVSICGCFSSSEEESECSDSGGCGFRFGWVALVTVVVVVVVLEELTGCVSLVGDEKVDFGSVWPCASVASLIRRRDFFPCCTTLEGR